jgi:hypothetical protein
VALPFDPLYVVRIGNLMRGSPPNGCEACRTMEIENAFPHGYRVAVEGHTCWRALSAERGTRGEVQPDRTKPDEEESAHG